ncbi:hypothetical protein ABB37_09759 [Leptomonas pyrrhocoris]|uniref:Transmembrane protein n=1 Tax=Leptomonas pyrrhocoris TaxID=157538 RepID=A0A0M9FPZ0_LEPPY|nr:hypothetical protein ABB37_09759 [Leptomonas pyrrhocoris]KPA73627.1 hypothetical protein ABB37_09759 [Leptomonas pyrrhocoris]|eukprot:XP_015652066.1 hypothetical protein ABB37_09759 [Leptomonas pyrrhocoris]
MSPSALSRMRVLMLVLVLLYVATAEPHPHPGESQLAAQVSPASATDLSASHRLPSKAAAASTVDKAEYTGRTTTQASAEEEEVREGVDAAFDGAAVPRRTMRDGTPPLRCADLFYNTTSTHLLRSSSSTSHVPHEEEEVFRLLPVREDCFLTPMPPAVLGSDRWQLFRSAATAGSRTHESDAVAVWQIGPHTPATQPLLENRFHFYFMNLSSSSSSSSGSRGRRPDSSPFEFGKETSTTATVTSGVLGQLARRLDAYNDLYTSHEARRRSPQPHVGANGVPIVVHRSSAGNSGDDAQKTRDKEANDHAYYNSYHYYACALEALQSCQAAVVSVLRRLGALEYVQRLGQEAYLNARVRAWSRWTTWTNVFFTRQLVLRFPVGSYAYDALTPAGLSAADRAKLMRRSRNDGEQRQFCVGGDCEEAEEEVAAAAGDEDPINNDRELLSRMDMAASSSHSLLRLLSFPPVAQRTPHALRYACSLSAVSAASLIVREDALAQAQQREATARLFTPGSKVSATSFATRWLRGGGASTTQHRGSAATAAAPSAPSRGLLVSHVLNFVFRLVQRLVNAEQDEDVFADISGNTGGAAYPGQAFSSATAGTAAATRLGSPAVCAARAFLRRVREELGPYQSTAVSSLPMALQQLIGSRVMRTQTQLIEEERETSTADTKPSAVGGNEKQTRMRRRRRVDFMMEWTATLPAGTPMCLALIALPDADGSLKKASPELHLRVEESLVFDQLWLLLLLAAYAVLQLERCVAQSAVARHIVTGLTGTLLLGVMVVFYVLRELQRMSVGKLAVVAALILGGSTAALEGIFSVLWSYYNLDSLWRSPSASHAAAERGDALLLLGLIVLSALFALNDLLFTLLIPAVYFTAVTRWSMRVLLGLLWWICLRRNAEATLWTVSAYVLVFNARWLWWALWSACCFCGCLPRRRTPQQPRLAASSGNGVWCLQDPLDEIPDSARQARGYVRPIAAAAAAAAGTVDNRHNGSGEGYARLSTTASRMKKFEEDGAASTRQALEALAAHLRANPGKYATRLRDPNGVQRWAGGTSDSTARESEASGDDDG